MKNNKLIAKVIFLLTLLSLPVSFVISAMVGEAEIFGVAGIIRYSWIMLLFVPVGILTLLTGKWLKRTGQNYKKYYIVAWICIPLLLIFGSYRFIFQGVSYEISDIYAIEEKTGLDLPDRIKMASHDYAGYSVSYIKVTDSDEAAAFVKEISTKAQWISMLSTETKGFLPFDIQAEITNFDFFVLFDLATGRYNVLPADDEHKCVFIAYDCDSQRLIVLDDYSPRFNKQ